MLTNFNSIVLCLAMSERCKKNEKSVNKQMLTSIRKIVGSGKAKLVLSGVKSDEKVSFDVNNLELTKDVNIEVDDPGETGGKIITSDVWVAMKIEHRKNNTQKKNQIR